MTIKIKVNHSRTLQRKQYEPESIAVEIEEEVIGDLTVEQIQQRTEQLFVTAKSTVFTQLGLGFAYDEASRTIIEMTGADLVRSPAPNPTPVAPQAASAHPTVAQSQPAPAPVPTPAPSAPAPAPSASAPSAPTAGNAPTPIKATQPMPVIEDLSYPEGLWWHLMNYPECWRYMPADRKKKQSASDFFCKKKPSEDPTGKPWYEGGYPLAANGSGDYPATLWLDNDFMNQKAGTVSPPAWFEMPDFD